MRRQVTVNLWAASAALVFAGFMALGSVPLYGAGLLLIPLVLLPLAPVGAFLERRFSFWRTLRKGAVIAYLLFLPFSLQLFGLMDAVILLVIFIQAYLLLGEKNARVYYELFLMSFFLLLAAVVQDPESMVAIALVLYAVSAVWAFTTLQMYVEIIGNDRLSTPEMISLNKDAESARVGNVFDFGLYLSLVVLSMLSILLTVVVFLLTPRVEAGWLGRRDAQQAVTGLSETVRLSGSTNISEDPSVIMHVRFPDEEEGLLAPESLLYWRVTTLPRFSAEEWSRRGLQGHYEPAIQASLNQSGRGWGASLQETKRFQRAHSRSIRQVIYMDNVPTQGIPCLDLPYGVRVLGETSYTRVFWDPGEDFTLSLETRGTRSLQYESVSDVLSHSEETLRAAPLVYDFVASRDYSLLTYHELLPETLALTRRLTESSPSPYEKVRALEAWLSSDAFVYSLDVPPLPARNSIDAFINTIRSGHCELYASALAMMARSLGIPARVVSGFRGGDYSPGDQAYMIRASMAHLWVEVLLKDIGWIRLDPSPRSDLSPTGLGRVRMAWSSYVLRTKMFWFQRVIGFRGGLRLDQLFRFRPWNWRPQAQHAAPETEMVNAPVQEQSFTYWGIANHPATQALAAVSIAAGILFLWRRHKKRIPRGAVLTRDQARIRSLYLRFMKMAAAIGVNCDNKSATEIWNALKEMPLADKKQVHAFIQAYHQVRFGGRPFGNDARKAAIRQLQGLKLRNGEEE